MCGITGMLSPDPSLLSIKKLEQMTAALAHRGPDGAGHWVNKKGNIALGHRRLSIIDLSNAASQPMHFLNRYTITFNGEIYNYIELRKELQAKGYRFQSASDTEVILAAFDHWKTGCLQQFDGMFAFAIWDEAEQQLFCARDRFGEKPFYFLEDKKLFLFASEMKALWKAGASTSANNLMVLNYLTIGYTSNPTDATQTFYRHIKSLPAGHFLLVSPQNEIKITQWYSPVFTVFDGTPEDAVGRFAELFKQSVAHRLRSDVAIGTSLSGGLDSSAITAGICENFGNSSAAHQKCFSAIFPGFEKDEFKYMQEVVQRFNLPHFTTMPTAAMFEASLQQFMHHQEEPLQSSSAFAQWEVYRLAKSQQVTVLLDGQGADEILAGYPKYYHWYWQQLFAEGRKKELAQERKLTGEHGMPAAWGIKNKLAALFPAFASARLSRNAVTQQLQNPFITKDFLNRFQQRGSLRKPVVNGLNDILQYDTFTRGLCDLLRYADRNSMAHGCEVRLPFLCHTLVEFIFSLPPDMKIKNGWTKWILRKAMAEKLPADIVWRKDKVGYEPPQQQWMRHPSVVKQIIDSRKKLVAENILKKDVLSLPVIASAAHDANNFDWRCLCVANMQTL